MKHRKDNETDVTIVPYHLTRICILGMSLNRVLSSHIPVAD